MGNLDTNLKFGTDQNAINPKKLIINGSRAQINNGPHIDGLNEVKKEEDDEKNDDDIKKRAQSTLSTKAASQSMKCVFLAFIKHFGFDDAFYKWSKNEAVDEKIIDLMECIWKYSCFKTGSLLREREDFRLKKVAIQLKKEDVKVAFDEFVKKRAAVWKKKITKEFVKNLMLRMVLEL